MLSLIKGHEQGLRLSFPLIKFMTLQTVLLDNRYDWTWARRDFVMPEGSMPPKS